MSVEDVERTFVHLEPGQGYNIPLGKFGRFMNHWRNGRVCNFPICCILRFSIQDARLDGKITENRKGQAVLRGFFKVDESNCVPCNLFHHKTEDW